MKTNRLGKTGLQVSEIGFGGEWLERHPEVESIELIRYASSKGINILDCWMAGSEILGSIIGEGINRKPWRGGTFRAISVPPGRTSQYYRTREMEYVQSGL